MSPSAMVYNDFLLRVRLNASRHLTLGEFITTLSTKKTYLVARAINQPLFISQLSPIPDSSTRVARIDSHCGLDAKASRRRDIPTSG